MWLFIGPRLLSGIGQVTNKYAKLMDAEYVVIGERPKLTKYDILFAFILPIDENVTAMNNFYKAFAPMHIFMTVSETETVNPCYEKVLQVSKTIYCPSQFSADVLARQFPSGKFKVLHHWTPIPKPLPASDSTPYTFYSIGNVTDPRKNIQNLLKVFAECKFPNARLVLKASCIRDVSIDVPNVEIINGLISDEDMEKVHTQCHCYVNCSHSEGVGMGAVEAAMYDKCVIISDYGGLKEYVRTPYVIPCTKGPIGFNDFLYTADLVWGHPDNTKLKELMQVCYDQNIRRQDHSFTRQLVGKVRSELLNIKRAQGKDRR